MNWLTPCSALQSRCLVKMHWPRNGRPTPLRLRENAKATWSVCAKDFGGQRIVTYLKEKVTELSRACLATPAPTCTSRNTARYEIQYARRATIGQTNTQIFKIKS